MDQTAAPRPRTGHPGPYRVFLVPHSHIDVEWYWTFDTTRALALTIFRDMLRLLEEDDEEAFCQDQVPLLELLRGELDGERLARLQRWIVDGRFEPVGGTYVQPEVAEPNGECLVRQCLIGRRKWRDFFGVEPQVGWFIDTFGQIPQIAQILVGCGIEAYVFMRGVPDRVGELPGTFWCQSPDGTRILTHWMASSYCTDERSLERSFLDEIAHASSPNLMIAWGADVTNPAAMPGRRAVRRLREIAANHDIPIASIAVATPSAFFRAAGKHAGDLPVIAEDHAPPEDRFADLRGTYSNRVQLKVANRRAEGALLSAEAWASFAAAFGADAPRDELDGTWQRLLYNHFHDIMGGSCTDAVYLRALRRFEAVVETAEAVADRALASLARRIDTSGRHMPVVVFNPTSTQRRDVVELDVVFREEPTAFRIVDEGGGGVPFHVSDARGRNTISTAHVAWLASDVPAFGYRLYRILPAPGKRPGSPEIEQEPAAENAWFRLTVDPRTGDIASIVDRVSGRDYLAGPGNEIIARREREPSMEGMVRLTGDEERTGDLDSATVESEWTHLYQRVRTITRFLGCTLRREVTLYADIPRIHLRTTFQDFAGGDVLVFVRFPVARAEMARHLVYETPYAMTERGDQYHCAQTVVDLNDEHRGVALINTGTAGYWAKENALEMVLFRSVADFRDYHAPLAAEHGTHVYDYALLPHDGDWRAAGVVAAGHAVNRPLRAHLVDAHTGEWETRRSFAATDSPDVEIAAIKRTEAGRALVLRVCETAGRHTTATVTLGFPARGVWRGTLSEERRAELPLDAGTVSVSLRPWEIGTLIVDLPE